MTLKRILPEDAARLMREGYVYLDVRNPDEFALGHPAGAYNVPWLDPQAATRTLNPKFLEVMQARFPKDQRIVVGCQTGRRSLSAAELLLSEGYSQIVEQRAGFAGSKDAFGGVSEKGWQASGLPVGYRAEAGHDYHALQAAEPVSR